MASKELKPNTELKELPKLLHRLTSLADMKIGVLKGTGEHPNADHGQTIAEIAAYNELGTTITAQSAFGPAEKVVIPARSFLRSTMREKRAALIKLIGVVSKKVVKKDISPDEAFELIGLQLQSWVRKKIDEITYPPNALSTRLQKGSSKPLVDTGTMRQSITYGKDG